MATTKSLPTAAEILDRFYTGERTYMLQPLSERDFSLMGKHLAEDVKLHQSADLPYGGVYEGHEGWQRCFAEMGKYYSALDVVDPKVFEGEAGVVVISTLKLTGRETGKQWVQPLCQHVQVDREKEVITEMRPFYWNVGGLRKVIGVK